MRPLYFFLFILVFMTSCEESSLEMHDTYSPLVVEGWIAEGENPVVMVTHAVALDCDRPDFSGFIEKWGRVSIFDGEKQYLLTGKLKKGYLPSFVFTSNALKGKAGHEYRLLVETEQGTAQSCARLVGHQSTLSLVSEGAEDNDSTFIIRAFVKDLDQAGCYKIYEKVVGKEEHFYPAFNATFMGSDFPEEGFVISRGQRIQTDTESKNKFSHFFKSGDVVQVRLCRIPQSLYSFWRVYDNTLALGSNMLFTFAENCYGNVEGAYGYWQPEGAVTKVIRIPILSAADSSDFSLYPKGGI